MGDNCRFVSAQMRLAAFGSPACVRAPGVHKLRGKKESYSYFEFSDEMNARAPRVEVWVNTQKKCVIKLRFRSLKALISGNI